MEEIIYKETTAYISADQAMRKIFGLPLKVKPFTRNTCTLQPDGVIQSHYCTFMVEGPETMGIASVLATQNGVTEIEVHVDDSTMTLELNRDAIADIKSADITVKETEESTEVETDQEHDNQECHLKSQPEDYQDDEESPKAIKNHDEVGEYDEDDPFVQTVDDAENFFLEEQVIDPAYSNFEEENKVSCFEDLNCDSTLSLTPTERTAITPASA